MLQETLITVVHAFVTSPMYYCNSLLYGISKYNLNWIQQILNSAAHIAVIASQYEHVTPVLQT